MGAGLSKIVGPLRAARAGMSASWHRGSIPVPWSTSFAASQRAPLNRQNLNLPRALDQTLCRRSLTCSKRSGRVRGAPMRAKACSHFRMLLRDVEAPGSAGRLLLIVACMFSMLKPWSAREMYSSPGFRSGTCFCVVRYIPRAVGMRYWDSRGAWAAGGGTCQCM